VTRHLLSIAELSPADFHGLIEQGRALKADPACAAHALYEKSLLMIFEQPSLRTRLSFETAMAQLHGHAINYYSIHSPWGAGKESIEDVGRTVSRYCDAVTARLFSHDDLERLAESASIPVINAMTDAGHPCQILGDFMTLSEHVGRERGLRIAYLGDARNNVTYSLMRAAALTGSKLVVGCPADERYAPPEWVREEVVGLCGTHGGEVQVTDDPLQAVASAEVVYTDSWMSYRTPPAEKEARQHVLDPYRVDADLLARAEDGALFMHCLPAWRGDEVTAEVIDGPQSIVFDQAENRLHVQKAILLELLRG
jgi:ornithine carbamoyltransferase